TPFLVALCRLQRHNVTRFLASRTVAAKNFAPRGSPPAGIMGLRTRPGSAPWSGSGEVSVFSGHLLKPGVQQMSKVRLRTVGSAYCRVSARAGRSQPPLTRAHHAGVSHHSAVPTGTSARSRNAGARRMLTGRETPT